jgi:hypothetical protein
LPGYTADCSELRILVSATSDLPAPPRPILPTRHRGSSTKAIFFAQLRKSLQTIQFLGGTNGSTPLHNFLNRVCESVRSYSIVLSVAEPTCAAVNTFLALHPQFQSILVHIEFDPHCLDYLLTRVQLKLNAFAFVVNVSVQSSRICGNPSCSKNPSPFSPFILCSYIAT